MVMSMFHFSVENISKTHWCYFGLSSLALSRSLPRSLSRSPPYNCVSVSTSFLNTPVHVQQVMNTFKICFCIYTASMEYREQEIWKPATMGGCRMRMRKSKGIQRFCMRKFVLPRKVLRSRVLLLKIISVSGKYTHYLSAHKPLFLLFQGPNSAQLNKGEIRASYFSATGC